MMLGYPSNSASVSNLYTIRIRNVTFWRENLTFEEE